MLQSNTHLRRAEYRRYFPDWTHRSLRVGETFEADHNSYLAGGYAEEFGYLPKTDSWLPSLAADSPDDDALRLVQRAGIHPGYPLRPYPISAERDTTAQREAPSRSSGGLSHVGESEVSDHGRFVRVTERPYERERGDLAHRLAAAVIRFLAAAVSLRRELPALRKGRQWRG